MSIEVKVPVLPESVTDATVASWHKKVGDFVARDDNMVDLETDKVVLEVPAPVDGYIKEIIKPEGETVGSDEVLAIFEEGEAPAATEEKTEAPQTPAKPATPPPAAAPARSAAVAQPRQTASAWRWASA